MIRQVWRRRFYEIVRERVRYIRKSRSGKHLVRMERGGRRHKAGKRALQVSRMLRSINQVLVIS